MAGVLADLGLKDQTNLRYGRAAMAKSRLNFLIDQTAVPL
jgi:hypothetical protein